MAFPTKTVLDWQQEGALLVEDGNHGENRPRRDEFSDVGMAFIRAADMANYQVLFESAEKINEIAQQRVRKGIGQGGDILISHKGTIGRVARVPHVCPPFVCSPQTTFWRVIDREKIDPDFLFCLLRSPKFQSEFAVRAGETDMAGYVSLTSQRALALDLPDIEIQREIGKAIAPIDQKIEMNRRMNETLEEMARALFRDWFVDFGPTRRQMEGTTDPAAIMGHAFPPEKAPPLAPLFPAKLGEDGLPEGWGKRALHDLSDWINGAAYKNMHFSTKSDALPVIKIAELKAGVTKTTKHTNTALGEKYRIRNGEVLFSWSGNPDTSIDTFIWSGGDAWLNQHIFAVRPNGEVDQSVLYFLLKYLRPQFAEIARDKQTTGLGHVTKQDLKGMRVCLGSDAVENAATEVLKPMFAKLYANQQENQTLAALRDLLLPKLMSGEVRLKDAEAVI